MSTVRLHKLISQYGYTSRRKAEVFIKEGRVKVDGSIIKELGVKVSEGSIVEVDGKKINKEISHVYMVLNKPVGFLCSKKDPFGRKLVYDLIEKKYIDYGVFSIGRLDYRSEGLLLITNDGQFAYRMSHPSTGILKKYEVTIDRVIPYNSIEMWNKGIYIKGEKYTIESCKKVSPKKLIITLYEGKNREIRKLFDNLNMKVLKLKRIAIGTLELGDLPPGRYRELTDEELKGLNSINL